MSDERTPLLFGEGAQDGTDGRPSPEHRQVGSQGLRVKRLNSLQQLLSHPAATSQDGALEAESFGNLLTQECSADYREGDQDGYYYQDTSSGGEGSLPGKVGTADSGGPEDGALTTRLPDEEAPFLGGVTRRRFWMIFGCVLTTLFLACFDGTIMASSHPVITSYFRSSNSASWLSTTFLLTSTSVQPLLGRMSDSIGRRWPYVLSVAIFTLATLWCALAGSMTSFILARAVCGIGAGGMLTMGTIVVSDLVPIEHRGNYQSYINIAYGLGGSLGAALGGAMADHLGWRWEFGVQCPALAVAVVIAALAIPGDLGLHGREREPFWVALKAFDVKGSILLTISTSFLILGLTLGGNVLPWSHPFVVISLVIFSVCFPIFIYVESIVGRPIMPLHLVRTSPHRNLILTNFIVCMINNAILFNVPLFFQGVLLESATASGIRLVLLTVVSSAAGTATGFLITWTRRLKWPLVLGGVTYLLGTLSLAAMRAGWADALYALSLVPMSLGQGFQFPGTFIAILAASPQRDQAVVTSTLILWRSLGNVLGIAASSLVLQNALRRFLQEYVQGPGSQDVIERVREAVETIRDLAPEWQGPVVRSYEAALRLTFLCTVVLAVVNLVFLLPVKLPTLARKQETEEE